MGRIDVLNREGFVEQLLRLVENMSANGAAASFAINGAWGCGKSFVLDMFEEQLSKYQSEQTATDKYFIIRYNCWKYDYYEEPLIAIVAAIIDVIERKSKLFPDNQDNREMLGMLKATGVSLLSMLNTAVKTKTGLDLQLAFETVNNGAKEAAAEYEKDHSFDVYFSFNKVMDKLNELLDQLSEKYTLVFLVDELDRCLPEYAIKVLERLHHLSEKSKNTITIISMDKQQLIKSVQQIFGFENPEKYLEKFIDFEIELNRGTISEKVSEKYAEYIDLFDKEAFVFSESIEEFIRELFADIDVRTQEHIFKRAMLVHRLLFSEKKDYSFMCMELLITVLICVYKDETCINGKAIQNTTLNKLFSSTRKGEGPAFEKAFASHLETLDFGTRHVYPEDRDYYILPKETSLYAAIAYSWYWIHAKHPKIAFGFQKGNGYDVMVNNHHELKEFATTLRMIKLTKEAILCAIFGKRWEQQKRYSRSGGRTMKKWLDRIGYVSLRMYLVVLLCLVIPVFLTFGFIRNQYEQYIQDQLSDQIVSSILKSEEALYDSFRNIAGISSAIVTNNALRQGLDREGQSYYSINKMFDECVNYAQINNLFMSGNMLVTLFDREGRCYTNWSRNYLDYGFLREEPWVAEAAKGKGHLVWNLFSPTFLIDKDEQYVSVARAVYDGALDDEALGVLIVSMPKSYLSQVLREYCYSSEDSVYVLGDGEAPILQYAPSSDHTELIAALGMMKKSEAGNFRLKTETGVKLVSYYTLDAPWTLGEQKLRIVHFTGFESVLRRMGEFSRRMSLMLVAALVITLMLVGVIVRMLVRPIRKLSDMMRHYSLGGSMEGLDMERRDEIGYLNRSFKKLTVNVQELFSHLDEEYRVKEQYRYESLRAQLNPHFLFNTLSTIRYMSILQHADSITEGIDALAAVLKYSIGREGKMSRLKDEIEHVKGYLAIQNMRFGRLIRLEEDFEPEVAMLCMPRFILQPIVENAVIHAFGENSMHDRFCLIRLYGYTEEGMLHLFVEDNGDGVAPQTIEALNHGRKSKDKMTGIGFSNVKKMIEMTFGKEYSLEIESHPGIGTVVHYRLPIIATLEEETHETRIDR